MEVESELLDRWGVTGRDRAKRSSRGVASCTERVARKRKPPCMRLDQSKQARGARRVSGLSTQ
eukprot:4525158-Pyramimonas_sp.AAC.1